MSTNSFWVTDDGQAMGRCSDCNAVLTLRKGDKHVVEVGHDGKVQNVICRKCWELLERSGADTT